MTWRQDKTEFYLKYLADDRPPRLAQTRPMSVGSAFDAYVKSYLHRSLFGDSDPKFEFTTLFETQVESQNRDWAIEAGEYCFHAYKTSGALADLMLLLNNSPLDPRFEFTATGIVDASESSNTGLPESTTSVRDGVLAAIGNVVLLGKPDAQFVTAAGTDVVLDWKVNGFCSIASPKPGYVKIRDGWDASREKPSRGANTAHPSAWPVMERGLMMNTSKSLHQVDNDWALQLSIYSWLCGEPVGGDFVVAIDQLVCKPDTVDCPLIRVAQHRNFISSEYQEALYQEIQEIWGVVQSSWIFRDVSEAESQERCAILDGQAAALRDAGSWFTSVTRG
jgi:hypothetical protein